MKTLYTAEALATGEGRDGHGRTSDGKLDLDLAIPKEMGGSGNGTNPEQLFASATPRASTPRCGWSVARRRPTSPIRLWEHGFRSVRSTTAASD